MARDGKGGRGGKTKGTPAAGKGADPQREGRGAMSAKQVLDLIKKNGVRIVDMRFCDFIGTWQHFSVPAHTLDENTFE